MLILTFLLTSFYIFILIILIRGLNRVRPGKNQTKYNVSVVVAARNEQENVEQCIQALTAQRYPKKKLEIIFVDDRSTDNTAQIIKKYLKIHSNLFLIQVDETATGMAPKKHALDQGIKRAAGDIICITDADTIPPPAWVESMVTYFEPSMGLVAGFAPLDRSIHENLFFKLIRLDSLSLAAVAASSFGSGFPLTCNARNLAYRKEVYHQVGGFQEIGHLISGDDDLFMHLIRNDTNWQFRYDIDSQSVVSSRAPETWRDFTNQRLRHASKGTYYSPGLKMGIAAVYLFNLLLLSLMVLSFFNSIYVITVGISLLIKSAGEFVLLYRTASIFNKKYYLTYFPITVLFHIPYIVIFGLLGQVSTFRWKGERFNAKL